MASSPPDEWSVLVVRMWLEGPGQGFRARVVESRGDREPSTTLFATPDDLLEALRQRINDLVERSQRG
jgi:hypothetical protein